MTRFFSTLVLAVALFATSAVGQEVNDDSGVTDTDTATAPPAVSSTTTGTTADDDENFDMGWIGLAGLAGLLGLLPKNRDTRRDYDARSDQRGTNR